MNKTKEILEALEKNEDKVVEIANELSKEGQVNAFKVFKKIKGEIKVDDSFKVAYGQKIREIISKKKKKKDDKPGKTCEAKKYPLSESLEEDVFKMLLEGKTEDQIREKYKDELDAFFLESTHISIEEFMKNFKCTYPDLEIPEDEIKAVFDVIYPEMESKSENPEEEVCLCDVIKTVYDKIKPKKEKKGPGGHEPDGTGPPEHGRGEGPGEGKGDGSGLE